MNKNILLLLLLLLFLISCINSKETNELAIPPFAKEELMDKK